ncbi:MAG: AraC family transcriptional regulator, partial [Chitinivibrionales bacterium]|nr:AraC family transcriptional regulator [Chitinivibrionales bacterium]
MRNTAGLHRRERFWHLHAGCTRIDDNNEHRIYRPGGMEGWILNCTTEGCGQVLRPPEAFTCSPGDLLLFPEGIAHDYGRLSGENVWEHRWVHFLPRPAWEEWMRWPETGGGVRRVRVGDPGLWDRIVRRMHDIAVLTAEPVVHRVELCLNAIEEILLWASCILASSHGASMDRRIRETIAYVREHYPQRLTVAALARRCALSPSRFAHLFRSQTGSSPIAYIERLRISRAQELLL